MSDPTNGPAPAVVAVLIGSIPCFRLVLAYFTLVEPSDMALWRYILTRPVLATFFRRARLREVLAGIEPSGLACTSRR